ncbi:MAG: bifunctional phosphopantothenoylcysteine decarboxylase/phosphopantothenate--cysteine ligase CoaBC [bacterium]|nr:bifunctional phosphopantothenoylcysteine decarboxylase/phosphopantothenate--cysteine ligase CoaBC [bacterium]
MLTGRKIVLGVSGGIAAYKSCELVREFTRRKADVHVVMTDSATRLVGPVTFFTLTYNPVLIDLFCLEGKMTPHISLVREGEVLVIAPATANIIGKAASGIADDALSTTILAFDGPKIIVPAMNWRMWKNPVVQENLARLRRSGFQVMPPEEGSLACGEEGAGRMAPVDKIVRVVEMVFTDAGSGKNSAGVLSDLRVMITAGATREFLDPVRYISNRASGELGHLVAGAFAGGGAAVTLVTAAGEHMPVPEGVHCIRVTTANEMYREVTDRFDVVDIVVASAGVCDWRPEISSPDKLKKNTMTEPSLKLVPNPDILKELGTRKSKQLLVGFAAESGDPLPSAREKLQTKNLDIIVANNVLEKKSGPGKEYLKPVIVFRDGRVEEGPVLSKREWAHRLVRIVAGQFEKSA